MIGEAFALLVLAAGGLAAPAGAERRPAGGAEGAAPSAATGERGADAGAAPAKSRIALERLRAEGIADALAEAVEAQVCAALGAAVDAEVICPADVSAAARLARQAALFGECAGEACLERVDALRAADARVTGAIRRGAQGLSLTLELVGPLGPGPRVAERLPEDLDALVGRIPPLVAKLFPRG